MKKIIFAVLFFEFFFFSHSFSQTNPRMENTNYMQTVFYDDFNSGQLNRTIWNVGSHEIREQGLFISVDSVATVNQNNGDLNLSMLYYPNYTTTGGNDTITITANFIAGGVHTYTRYTYGVYECNATLSDQPGAFPAFWLMSAEPCGSSFNNEIDIVELKYNHDEPTLDNNIIYWPMICGTPSDQHEFTRNPFTWGGAHTFKCMWAPSHIEFWVDNTKLKEVQNTGQDWYPQLAQRVILSQQIIRYNNNSPI